MIDGPRRGLRGTWIYFVMSLFTSFSFAMGLYLAAQERQVRWTRSARLTRGPGAAIADYDVIVVGAGHNGLAATALLAARGLRVLCLEKNAYVGGMAGTREILTGCRNDVGASLLFPLAKGLAEELELARYGVELIDLPIMASNLNSRTSPPAIFYSNPAQMALYVLRHFGVRAMVGFVRLMAFCKYPASVMHRFTPRSIRRRWTSCSPRRPNERKRRQLALAFTGSAMDLVDRFLPDRQRHRTLRALVAFAAVQSTYKGPFTPGSALCLVYTFAQNEGGGLMRRVKGGMGIALGGALPVDRRQGRRGACSRRRSNACVIEDGRAVGVELRDGTAASPLAPVLSNLDKPATFFGLVGPRASRRVDHRADRARRAPRRLHAPALQALAPAALRAAVRAPERRPADALQHHARPGPRAAAGELRSLPARRGAGASAGRHADTDGDGPEPGARRLPHRDDLRLLLPVRGAEGESAAASATRWPSGSSTGSPSSSPTSATASSSARSSRRTTSRPCRARPTATSRTG